MSFKPSRAVESTGAAFDGTVVTAKTGQFNYGDGSSGRSAIGIILGIKDDESGQVRQYPDTYSAGQPATVLPTADEKGFRFASDAKKDQEFELNSKSKAFQFMAAVVESGFPEASMEVNGNTNDITFLVGHRFNFALREGKGLDGQPSGKGMFPVKYLGKGTVATSAPVAVAASDEDVISLAQGLVIAVVSENGGKFPRQKLNATILGQVTDIAQKGAVAKLLTKEGFLKSIPGIKFDGQTLVSA